MSQPPNPKKRVVVFGPMGAKILVNPEHIESLLSKGNALLNPDVTKVSQTPPQFWKKVGNQVEVMNEEEREKVLSLMAAGGHAMPVQELQQAMVHYASLDHVGSKVGEVEANLRGAILNLNDKLLKYCDDFKQEDSNLLVFIMDQDKKIKESLHRLHKEMMIKFYVFSLILVLAFFLIRHA